MNHGQRSPNHRRPRSIEEEFGGCGKNCAGRSEEIAATRFPPFYITELEASVENGEVVHYRITQRPFPAFFGHGTN
jgi:hypothetical protein